MGTMDKIKEREEWHKESSIAILSTFITTVDGVGISRIEKSKSASFKEGDFVVCYSTPWVEYGFVPTDNLMPLHPDPAFPLSYYVNVLGTPPLPPPSPLPRSPPCHFFTQRSGVDSMREKGEERKRICWVTLSLFSPLFSSRNDRDDGLFWPFRYLPSKSK
jgi:hypothetical protein